LPLKLAATLDPGPRPARGATRSIHTPAPPHGAPSTVWSCSLFVLIISAGPAQQDDSLPGLHRPACVQHSYGGLGALAKACAA